MNVPATSSEASSMPAYAIAGVLGFLTTAALAASIWSADAFRWTMDYLERYQRLSDENSRLADAVRARLLADAGLDAVMARIRREIAEGRAPAQLAITGGVRGTYATDGDRYRAEAVREGEVYSVRATGEIANHDKEIRAQHTTVAMARIEAEKIEVLDLKQEPAGEPEGRGAALSESQPAAEKVPVKAAESVRDGKEPLPAAKATIEILSMRRASVVLGYLMPSLGAQPLVVNGRFEQTDNPFVIVRVRMPSKVFAKGTGKIAFSDLPEGHLFVFETADFKLLDAGDRSLGQGMLARQESFPKIGCVAEWGDNQFFRNDDPQLETFLQIRDGLLAGVKVVDSIGDECLREYDPAEIGILRKVTLKTIAAPEWIEQDLIFNLESGDVPTKFQFRQEPPASLPE